MLWERSESKDTYFHSEGFDTKINSLQIVFAFLQNVGPFTENVCLIEKASVIGLSVFQLYIYFLEDSTMNFPRVPEKLFYNIFSFLLDFTFAEIHLCSQLADKV